MPNAAALVVRIRAAPAPAVRGDADDRLHPARRIARRLCRRTDPAESTDGARCFSSAASCRCSWPRPAEGAARVAALSRPTARALARAARRCSAGWVTTCRRTRLPRWHARRPSARRRCASSSSRSSGATRWRSAARSSSACSRCTSAPTGSRRCWRPRAGFDVGHRQLRPDRVQLRRRRRRDPRRARHRAPRIADLDADDVGRRRSPARLVLSLMAIGPQASVSMFAMLAWTGGLINAVADDDVRARRACLSDLDPRHGRRHGRGLRPHRRRSSARRSGLGARHRAAPRRYFRIIAGTMAVTFAALAAVRHHIPGASAVPALGPVVAASVRQ